MKSKITVFLINGSTFCSCVMRSKAEVSEWVTRAYKTCQKKGCLLEFMGDDPITHIPISSILMFTIEGVHEKDN